ncbi:MAG: type II toxin-antitoxin system HicA family toxin [Verrucomicrobia bacterium]|nr:type II toxin-antitoxin system HicA family toxin [Verrucomicrobiota bacterium]
MKRRDLVRRLTAAGCMLLRPGGRHDIYLNPATGKKQPVPRHTEVDDNLARHIRRVLGVPE